MSDNYTREQVFDRLLTAPALRPPQYIVPLWLYARIEREMPELLGRVSTELPPLVEVRADTLARMEATVR